MGLFDRMYLLSRNEYQSLTQAKNERDSMVNSIRGDVNGGQVNHIEIGEGGRVVIKPNDIIASQKREKSAESKTVLDESTSLSSTPKASVKEGEKKEKRLSIEDVLQLPLGLKETRSAFTQTDKPENVSNTTQTENPAARTIGTQAKPSTASVATSTSPPPAVKKVNVQSTIAPRSSSSFPSANAEATSVGTQTIPLAQSKANVTPISLPKRDSPPPPPAIEDLVNKKISDIENRAQPENMSLVPQQARRSRSPIIINRESPTSPSEPKKLPRSRSPIAARRESPSPTPVLQNVVREKIREINEPLSVRENVSPSSADSKPSLKRLIQDRIDTLNGTKYKLKKSQNTPVKTTQNKKGIKPRAAVKKKRVKSADPPLRRSARATKRKHIDSDDDAGNNSKKMKRRPEKRVRQNDFEDDDTPRTKKYRRSQGEKRKHGEQSDEEEEEEEDRVKRRGAVKSSVVYT